MQIKKSAKTFMLINLILLLVGCGSGKVVVYEPPEMQHGIKTLKLVMGKHTSDVPNEVKELFEKEMQDRLFKEYGYGPGDDLTIVYRFLQCDEGSRFSRWFWGGLGNSGESSLTIEAKFINSAGKELGKINTEGKIGSGFLGGSFDNAIEQASDYLSAYIAKHFKKR